MVRRLALLTILLALGVSAAAPRTASAQKDPCAAAKAVADAGQQGSAKRAYTRLLLADPQLECAKDALTKLNAEPAASEAAQELCDRGAAYLRAGRNDDAVKAYKAALEKDPSKGNCGEKGLDEVASTWRARAKWVIGAVPDVAAGLGILAVIGLLLLMLGHIPSVHRRYMRLPLVKTLLKPRLTLDDLGEPSDETKAGAAVTARIRERLQRFREAADDDTAFADNLEFGTSTEELADIVSGDEALGDALDKLKDVGGHAGAIAALLGLIASRLPIKRFALSGVLEPVSGPAASATLSMESGQRLAGAVTLTGRELDTDPVAGDYLALAPPAAVWLQLEVVRALVNEPLSPEIPESYALVREGLDHYAHGATDEAIAAFQAARVLDSRNWAAKVNLAVAQARLAREFDVAERTLEQALTDFRDEYE